MKLQHQKNEGFPAVLPTLQGERRPAILPVTYKIPFACVCVSQDGVCVCVCVTRWCVCHKMVCVCVTRLCRLQGEVGDDKTNGGQATVIQLTELKL